MSNFFKQLCLGLIFCLIFLIAFKNKEIRASGTAVHKQTKAKILLSSKKSARSCKKGYFQDGALCVPNKCRDAGGIKFDDSALIEEIRSKIGKMEGAIYYKDVKVLDEIDISYEAVSSIAGIECLSNLTSLNLDGNNISDISVLSKLSNLTSLELAYNEISDISVLSKLRNLTSLNLYSNKISDISALYKLRKLTEYLGLWGNPIDCSDPILLKFIKREIVNHSCD